MASGQYELADPPSDAISSVRFAPESTKLLVASWDKHVYLYEASTQADSRLIRSYEHRAPVLDACFGGNEDVAYSVGLDWDVRRIDLANGEQTVLSSHEAPSNAVVHHEPTNLLISSSWDGTLHIHDTTSGTSLYCMSRQPSKPFALSGSPSYLVVAMANRQFQLHKFEALAQFVKQYGSSDPEMSEIEPFQRRDSSMKFMTRAVACKPTDDMYACSSIEGRVAVEFFDASPEAQAKKYAFKCHRQPASEPTENGQPMDVVYPVHALAFHPEHGTFVTGGGDGVVSLWDADHKRRIRQYQRLPASIAALSFSSDGKRLATGVCPGFEDGKEDVEMGPVKVYVRELSDSETKGKGAK
ncbi:MAG: hypothetical protein M1828_007392 [Chrysothrix sp. TS-e1954]|nr:MAG: hypothetical protein M1828_007392 [Chrysothrix sp. TS-e1954]